jgi:hypothetical protein
MLPVSPDGDFIVPAPFTLFTLCRGYFRPHLFFIFGQVKGDGRDNKDGLQVLFITFEKRKDLLGKIEMNLCIQ